MTLLGIVIEVRFTQFKKTPAPSVVILLEILIDFKLIQRLKATSSIVVTLLGILTDVKLLQSEYLLLVDYQCYTL